MAMLALLFTMFSPFAQDLHGIRSNGLKLQFENCRADRLKYSFSVWVAKIRNAFPQDVVTSCSIADFIKQLNSANDMKILNTFAVCY